MLSHTMYCGYTHLEVNLIEKELVGRGGGLVSMDHFQYSHTEKQRSGGCLQFYHVHVNDHNIVDG